MVRRPPGPLGGLGRRVTITPVAPTARGDNPIESPNHGDFHMFDLEAQIRSWRQRVSTSLGDGPDVLDELDEHLRDDFDRLVRSGEAPDRAWSAAVARIGSREQLAREFAKVKRPAWLPARVATAAFMALALATGVLVASRLVGGRTELLLA